MKKSFTYLLILNGLCFFHLNSPAASCEEGFLEKLKRFVSRQMEGFSSRLSKPVSKKILLSELKDNPAYFSIFSAALPTPSRFGVHGAVLGDYNYLDLPKKFLSKTPTQPVTYSAFYTSQKSHRRPQDPIGEGEKGKRGSFFLLLTIRLDVERDYDTVYRHWIHWPSNAKNAYLSEGTIKDIFNAIYETVYGRSLDWMIRNNAFSIIQNHTHTRDGLDPEAPKKFWKAEERLNNVFEFYDRFFEEFKPWLKVIIAKALVRQWPRQAETSQEQTPPLTPSTKFDTLRPLLRNSDEQFSVEQLKTMPPEQIRRLSAKEMVQIFNTPEKIQVLDMSSGWSENQIYLLANFPLWRESITKEQVQQLDTSAYGIQHVLIYTYFFRLWQPSFEKTKLITIDTLTDAQIEKMDRDTFLRDFFLAGEPYINGLPFKVTTFTMKREKEASGLTREDLMGKSLPKKMHDFIAQQLGFNTEFESMTVAQKRELFTAEAKMMVDGSQIEKMLTSVIQENERGNHNWF